MTNPRTKSIRVQLTASYTAVLALTFALIGGAVWIALERSIEETADRELRSRLTDVRRYVDSFSPDDLLHLEEEFREESLLSQSVANVRICDFHGKWLYRTNSTDHWPAQSLETANLSMSGRISTMRIKHDLIRVLTAPIKVGIVQIGLSIDEFEEVKRGFLWLLLLGSPPLLALAALGGYWLSGRALKPVDEISRAASRIGVRDLSARLPASGVGDELDRLSSVLNQMLSRLESAFNRIGEFTADASHELRTPVAVIQTTAELMQTRPRTEEEHLRAWASVSKETERTSLLIGDLLTLARSDSGKLELELRGVNFSEIVQAAVEEMRVMAEAKELRLILDIANPCSIRGDGRSLHRLVCILLDNAIKFSTKSTAIRVTLASGTRTLLSVSDEGPGIPAAELECIFERFYRVSKDRSRMNGGAGLGLSIARSIVEMHAGIIKAESILGKGSTFTVSLPSN